MADPQHVVHVVDDDAAVRQALHWLMQSQGLDARGYGSGRELLETLATEGDATPACVLLDMRLPDMDGLTVQAHIKRAAPRLPVIVITGHGDVTKAVQAMRDGARDFIEKPIHEPQLLRAVRDALAAAAAPTAPSDDLPTLRHRFAQLSPRESEVMRRVVRGELNKQVAAELGVSPKTVELHRAHVMQKMAAGNLAELVRMAVKLESAGVC